MGAQTLVLLSFLSLGIACIAASSSVECTGDSPSTQCSPFAVSNDHNDEEEAMHVGLLQSQFHTMKMGKEDEGKEDEGEQRQLLSHRDGGRRRKWGLKKIRKKFNKGVNSVVDEVEDAANAVSDFAKSCYAQAKELALSQAQAAIDVLKSTNFCKKLLPACLRSDSEDDEKDILDCMSGGQDWIKDVSFSQVDATVNFAPHTVIPDREDEEAWDLSDSTKKLEAMVQEEEARDVSNSTEKVKAMVQERSRSKSGSMQVECNGDCDECDWNGVDKAGRGALGGAGHSAEECLKFCLDDAQCNVVALSKDGYCHSFATCTPGTGTNYALRWRKPQATLVAYSKGSYGNANVGREAFDKLFVKDAIVHRECSSCRESHKNIYYLRLTDVPLDLSGYDLFLTTWSSSHNRLNTDFRLYGSLEDLYSDSNRWSFCNYDYVGVGFPRDCGPNDFVFDQWNSLTVTAAGAADVRFTLQPQATLVAYSKGSYGNANVGREVFDTLFVKDAIVHRECSSCTESHKNIYYLRLTDVPADLSGYDLFLTTWSSSHNELNIDFRLYGSLEDLNSDSNSWSKCNYNDVGIGFPRDCGPTKKISKQWNSLTRGGQADVRFTIQQPAKDTQGVCTNGILDNTGSYCCASSCGSCTGTGCADRPGGPSQCCGGGITTPCMYSSDVGCFVEDTAADPLVPKGKSRAYSPQDFIEDQASRLPFAFDALKKCPAWSEMLDHLKGILDDVECKKSVSLQYPTGVYCSWEPAIDMESLFSICTEIGGLNTTKLLAAFEAFKTCGVAFLEGFKEGASQCPGDFGLYFGETKGVAVGLSAALSGGVVVGCKNGNIKYRRWFGFLAGGTTNVAAEQGYVIGVAKTWDSFWGYARVEAASADIIPVPPASVTVGVSVGLSLPKIEIVTQKACLEKRACVSGYCQTIRICQDGVPKSIRLSPPNILTVDMAITAGLGVSPVDRTMGFAGVYDVDEMFNGILR